MERLMQEKTTALEERGKEMHDTIAKERESARIMQEKLQADIERERQTVKEEHAKITRMPTDAQTKSELALMAQQAAADKRMNNMMDRASSEWVDLQRRVDAAQVSAHQSLSWNIQRLEGMIAQEALLRRSAEQRASNLQVEVEYGRRKCKIGSFAGTAGDQRVAERGGGP
ncbi:hypothetical protein B0H34DRAFT_730723 [Crassisporium funariophilum]|nr:hypothetical protein B0H34DRAFT_730723 [Crassisporium funariophilum]